MEGLRISYGEAAVRVQARHLMTPLASALTLKATESGAAAARLLAQQGFTYAPAIEGELVIGHASAKSLEASVRVADAVTPIGVGRMVSGDTPLPVLMSTIATEPFLFVLEGTRFSGFVVPADLNKHAARLHWYLLLAGFEIALADLIREAYIPPSAALSALTARRADAVRERFERLREEDFELDEITSMDLTDLLRAAARAPKLLQRLGFHSKSGWDGATGWLPGFRHTVMHPVRPLITSEIQVPELIEREEALRELLEMV